MGGPIGKFLCMRYNFFARAILPGGMSRRNAKTPALVRNYAVQFKTPARRKATYTFARHIRKAAGWLAHIHQHLGVLSQVPVEMVWGRRDPIFGKRWYVRQWKKVFPYAHADTIVRASHYVPEDAPGRVTGAIQRLLERL
jgi:haloalkane dehalogenase